MLKVVLPTRANSSRSHPVCVVAARHPQRASQVGPTTSSGGKRSQHVEGSSDLRVCTPRFSPVSDVLVVVMDAITTDLKRLKYQRSFHADDFSMLPSEKMWELEQQMQSWWHGRHGPRSTSRESYLTNKEHESSTTKEMAVTFRGPLRSNILIQWISSSASLTHEITCMSKACDWIGAKWIECCETRVSRTDWIRNPPHSNELYNWADC